MSIDLDGTPADARRWTVHDAWRIWRAGHPDAPATAPPVSPDAVGDGPSIREALRAWPAEAVRWALLAAPPHAPLAWSEAALQEALQNLAHVYEARATASAMAGEEPAVKVVHALGAPARDAWEAGRRLPGRLASALNDGFDVARALEIVSALATAMNRFANHKQAGRRGSPVVAPALEAMDQLPAALGLLADPIAVFRTSVARKRLPARGLSPGQVQALVDDRRAARTARDWERADALRAELDAAGIVIIDRDGRTEWRVRP